MALELQAEFSIKFDHLYKQINPTWLELHSYFSIQFYKNSHVNLSHMTLEIHANCCVYVIQISS